MGIRAQRRPPLGGEEELVGRTGVTRTPVHTDGTVFVGGEYWQAISEAPIPQGRPVRVVAVSGARLAVEEEGPTG
jgi:membrane-bound serine protease (ClpP class)